MTTKVYVGDLGENGDRREIETKFEAFGPVKDVWVARNPPGFAFVFFEDSRDAQDAVRELDGSRCCGVKIRVDLARARSPGARGGRGGGRGRDGYRGGGGGGGYGGGRDRYSDRGGGRYDDRDRDRDYGRRR